MSLRRFEAASTPEPRSTRCRAGARSRRDHPVEPAGRRDRVEIIATGVIDEALLALASDEPAPASAPVPAWRRARGPRCRPRRSVPVGHADGCFARVPRRAHRASMDGVRAPRAAPADRCPAPQVAAVSRRSNPSTSAPAAEASPAGPRPKLTPKPGRARSTRSKSRSPAPAPAMRAPRTRTPTPTPASGHPRTAPTPVVAIRTGRRPRARSPRVTGGCRCATDRSVPSRRSTRRRSRAGRGPPAASRGRALWGERDEPRAALLAKLLALGLGPVTRAAPRPSARRGTTEEALVRDALGRAQGERADPSRQPRSRCRAPRSWPDPMPQSRARTC